MGDAVTAATAGGADIVGTGNADAPGVDGGTTGGAPVVAVTPVVAVVALEDPAVVP